MERDQDDEALHRRGRERGEHEAYPVLSVGDGVPHLVDDAPEAEGAGAHEGRQREDGGKEGEAGEDRAEVLGHVRERAVGAVVHAHDAVVLEDDRLLRGHSRVDERVGAHVEADGVAQRPLHHCTLECDRRVHVDEAHHEGDHGEAGARVVLPGLDRGGHLCGAGAAELDGAESHRETHQLNDHAREGHLQNRAHHPWRRAAGARRARVEGHVEAEGRPERLDVVLALVVGVRGVVDGIFVIGVRGEVAP
mmetsp:Transcript_14632/g.29331  ORF Transcript_14632/g.29331 Transcript_14632/m.29331 type:complete len:250 (+) Transcript_14632:436-1185(+)